MSSEIGNKSLLRAVADFLGIVDVKRFANRLDTGNVIPVIDIGRGSLGGTPGYELGLLDGIVDLTGTSQFSFELAGATDDFEQKVIACEIIVHGDPDIAENGMSWKGEIVYGETGISIWNYRYWDTTKTAEWTDRWALWGSMLYHQLAASDARNRPAAVTWDGWIPRGTSLVGQLDYRGTVWPADTDLTYQCLVAKFPKGVRPF